MIKPPHIDDAPGLSWRKLKVGWQARWRPRVDLVKRGFDAKIFVIWTATPEKQDVSALDMAYIADCCGKMQREMLMWGRGGLPVDPMFDGTLKTLAACYQSDADSPYRKCRYRTRIYYDALIRRLVNDHGDDRLIDLKARAFLRWYEDWATGENGKRHIPRAHSQMGMLRTLVNFGASFLENEECERLSTVLHRMKFEQGKARTASLSADQAIAIRHKAHQVGRASIALGQATQFDLMVRQKDVIGEWVPIPEPGVSDIMDGNMKWLRGIRWEEIDANMILHHVTSKRGKLIEPDLKLATMILEELALIYGIDQAKPDRSLLPASGPFIVAEGTHYPYTADEFRRWWRQLATMCEIPTNVRNMDSRSGAITEALAAGASLDAVRKSATHSDAQMTQRYSRGDAEAAAQVAQLRVAHRNKAGK